MGKFGWSYPAGCTGTPFDNAPEPSELQEAVLLLLEDADIPTAVNDQIMKLIEDAETAKFQAENNRPDGTVSP